MGWISQGFLIGLKVGVCWSNIQNWESEIIGFDTGYQ
jgi:hypothetical protein